MNKLALILGFTFATVLGASAQQAATTAPATTQKAKELPEAKAKKQLGKINNAAKLEGEQTTKVNTILIDYYKKKDEVENNTKVADKKLADEKIEALKKDRDKKLKDVLSAAQWKKWLKYKEEKKDDNKDSKE